MPRNKDPFARDKQASLLAKHRAAHKAPAEAVDQRRLEVWRLRTDERMTVSQIAKQLSISTSIVYDDLNNKRDQVLAALSEYGELRRKESERELEDLKAMLTKHIYSGDIELMRKVVPLFLGAMNTQNKLWGLYTVPERPRTDETSAGAVNIKNDSIN